MPALTLRPQGVDRGVQKLFDTSPPDSGRVLTRHAMFSDCAIARAQLDGRKSRFMIIKATVVRVFAMLVLALSIPFAGVANAEGEGDHGGPILPINGPAQKLDPVEVYGFAPHPPLSSGFL